MSEAIDTAVDLASRLDRVQSELEIRQLPARYALAVDSRDLQALGDLFVADVDNGPAGQGRDALREWFNAVLKQFYRSMHLDDADQARLSKGAAAQGTAYRTVPQGAATSVWAATSRDLDDVGGVYLEDCAVAPVTGPEETHGVRDFAVDPQRARRLWELSEQLVTRAAGTTGTA
jgi:hypothetical protein